MSFSNLKLNANILKAIKKSGYDNPRPIQLEAIPHIIEGKDVQGSAETGTGKTAAFTLPTLHILSEPSKLPGKGPRALIIVPTRELAMQVAAATAKYSEFLPRMKTVCIYGGSSYLTQNKQLSRPYEILVATPGRLIDHVNRGRIDFSRLEIFIMDEADRMLDMGFINDVEKISSMIPDTVQTLMFSATFKGEILKLSRQLLRDPVEITIQSKDGKHENIEQVLHYVDNLPHKLRLLDHLLNDESMQQAIIFTSTKVFADELVDKLIDMGHRADALHGDMSQQKRTRTIKKLREGSIRILVATDVAARGLDVYSITHVINFDLPNNAEDYVHRIGRTGRADAKGKALSFASPKDHMILRKIEDFTGHKLLPLEIAGFEPTIRQPNFSRRDNNNKNKPSFRSKSFRSNGRNPNKKPFSKQRSY